MVISKVLNIQKKGKNDSSQHIMQKSLLNEISSTAALEIKDNSPFFFLSSFQNYTGVCCGGMGAYGLQQGRNASLHLFPL